MDNGEDQSPFDHKIKGDQALTDNRFQEAIIHYTYAIDLSQKSRINEAQDILHSSRSRAYLKNNQYYYALQDANRVIKLNPSWHQGYFRKGEVLMATRHYRRAAYSYTEALKRLSNDNLVEALVQNEVKKRFQQAWKEVENEDRINRVIPWLGAGGGIIVGVILMLADALSTPTPTHPLLMAIITITISIFGYALALIYRGYRFRLRELLLEPPEEPSPNDNNRNDGEGKGNEEELSEQKEPQKHLPPRYSKSQARQRYKKGKM